MEVTFHSFFKSLPNRAERSDSLTNCHNRKDKYPNTQWIQSYVAPQPVWKRKLLPCTLCCLPVAQSFVIQTTVNHLIQVVYNTSTIFKEKQKINLLFLSSALSFSNELTLLATSTFAVVAKAAIPSIYKKIINK